jgi:hypothetical protein
MTLKRLGQPPLSEKMYDLPANGIKRDCFYSQVILHIHFDLITSLYT